MSQTILAIDHERETWERVEPHLKAKGYYLQIACSLEQGLERLRGQNIDLVLLHEFLPNTDYLDAIKLIKASYVVPLVVIAENSNTVETVTSLELGADDFISTPLELDELSARIKANLRLVEEIQQETKSRNQDDSDGDDIIAICFDQWRLDMRRQELLDQSGEATDLTPGEFRLLATLARSAGIALSRDRLLEETRERDAGEFDRAVDVQISRLRQKLGDSEREKPLIRTIRSFGYMLDVETEITR